MNVRPKMTALALAAVLLAGCGSSGNQASPEPTAPGTGDTSSAAMTPSATDGQCPELPADPGWYGDNHKKLNEMLTQLGDCSGTGDVASGAPLALFDWDNTVVKNDIGDATTYWMIANGKVLQPADWAKVSTWLTPEATQALTAACGSLAEPGQPLPTNTEAGLACADEILEVYSDGDTTTDQKAFTGYNARRIEPQYAFAAQLLAGYTDAEVMDFARQAREQNLNAAEGTEQKVGSESVTGWVRYYDQVTKLIEVMKARGFDVRIVSASSEPVVRVWAESLGLEGDKVMGVTVNHDGDKLTSTLTGCGGDEASITYIEGKRCRVNEQIFGITGAAAFEPAPDGKRPAFGAGDSDTDISFMIDATVLRLAINRNKTELMCHAYDNEDGKWIINPMFIDPKDAEDDLYPCSTAGEILPDGGKGPLKDIAGNLIEDQKDTVHG
ncbi:MAG: haloacid dehalogenase-like hydrolase [Propionibacteriaceae bacterium]|nr:haloacid dehalogenase-like hydrolase [Propionibacteriaceae bacterium]